MLWGKLRSLLYFTLSQISILFGFHILFYPILYGKEERLSLFCLQVFIVVLARMLYIILRMIEVRSKGG